jgi:hypothetical protein
MLIFSGNESIATGHSRVDNYISFDVVEYARLARWTGHPHYVAIPTPLLHDMKNITAVAVRGRLLDLTNGTRWVPLTLNRASALATSHHTQNRTTGFSLE